MKKQYMFICIILVMGFLFAYLPEPMPVRAASGKLTVRVDDTNVEKGETFTLRVQMSSDVNITVGSFNIIYDSKLFSCRDYAGSIPVHFDPSAPGAKVEEFSYPVKAIQTGTGSFTIENCKMVALINGDIERVPFTTNSLDVRVWAEGSDDASLKSLEVPGRTLTPAFRPGTTSYTVYLPNSVARIDGINAVASQPASAGSRVEMSTIPNPVPVGESKVNIKVFAPNGSSMTYTITFIREAPPMEPTPVQPTPVPPEEIPVIVDGEPYTVERDFAGVTPPEGFEEAPGTYQDEEITIAKGIRKDLTLLYLKDANGFGAFYIYFEGTNTFTRYIGLQTNSVIYTVLHVDDTVKVPDRFSYTDTMELFGETVTVWTQEASGEHSFVLFYGMNWNGESAWYQYDTMEHTVQRYTAPEPTPGDDPAEPSPTPGRQDEDFRQQYERLQAQSRPERENYQSDQSLQVKCIIALAVLCVAGITGIVWLLVRQHRRKKQDTFTLPPLP